MCRDRGGRAARVLDAVRSVTAEFTQEGAPNESERTPKPPNRETLIDEALFVALWLQSRFEKGS